MTFFSTDKRKTYVLSPRGKPLFDDANRFGTKMLEKMGWSKGKGLGVNLDGEQNFIKISHKADQKGIGFEDRDDQWTQHQNQFNSLLKSLDNSAARSENEDNNDGDADELSAMSFRGFGFADADEKPSKKKKKSITDALSGKSLEEMSKNSKARVHYKKFTRGKDLSKYSEKDLANIFGKKIEDDATETNLSDETVAKQKNAELPLSNYGITTIETGTTISDYFYKKKTNLLKRGAANDETSTSSSNSSGLNSEDSLESDQKKKKTRKEKDTKPAEVVAVEVVDEETNTSSSNSLSPNGEDSQEPEKKKKRKEKDTKPAEVMVVEVVDEETNTSSSNSPSLNSEESQKPKKKKKKGKNVELVLLMADEVVNLVDEVETKKEMKSKNKKEKIVSEEVIDLESDEDDAPVAGSSSKKKNKKKEKREISESETVAPIDADATIIIIDASPVAKIKNKKSQKRSDVVDIKEVSTTDEVTTSTHPIISNILTTLIYVNHAVDSSTEQQKNASVTIAGTESSKSTSEFIQPFVHETFEINRYQAELFRFVDLDGFTGANLTDLTGYGFSKNIDLKITARTQDRNRINDLWDNALINKYGKDVIKAKKKQKYSLKTLKNKKLFKAI